MKTLVFTRVWRVRYWLRHTLHHTLEEKRQKGVSSEATVLPGIKLWNPQTLRRSRFAVADSTSLSARLGDSRTSIFDLPASCHPHRVDRYLSCINYRRRSDFNDQVLKKDSRRCLNALEGTGCWHASFWSSECCRLDEPTGFVTVVCLRLIIYTLSLSLSLSRASQLSMCHTRPSASS